MAKIFAIVLAVSVVLGFLVWKFAPIFNSPKTNPNQKITLNIWGLWEDDSFLRPAISSYQSAHPNVTINYTHRASTNYRTIIQTQIWNKADPDIFMIHDSWLPMFLQAPYLSSAPSSVMSLQDFSNSFYPVAKDSLTKDGQIYALPIEIDGLAMYYNEDLLNPVGAQVPKYWIPTSLGPDFITEMLKVRVIDSQGVIKTAGAALGTTGNVDFWPDIIGLLFSQQPGADLNHPSSNIGAQVLKFYTGFVTQPQYKTWDATLESSTQAFEEGKLAFYFAPSWKADEIRRANPQLHFKIAPVPQLPGDTPVSWASFWALAVSKKSQNQAAAWDFLKFLTSAQTEKLLYSEASKVRLFGEPYSRRDLASEVAGDPWAGAFVNQGPQYKFWYLSSQTFDSGINEGMIKYYEDAINATLAGTDPATALQTTEKGVTQVLTQFTQPAQAQVAPSASP